MSNVIGADRLRRRLRSLKKNVADDIEKSNERTGKEMVRIARLLHPGDGETRDDIQGQSNADGSYLVDFGDKAKVTEGDRGPRPYVNPTLSVMRDKARRRMRYAVNKAVKRTFNG